ncbi:MAG: protein phosphatase CheZ [Deltaproteobacteria bacterium]|nr:protein phosphatase CheZ [Deltaproteobacteria bacterium]
MQNAVMGSLDGDLENVAFDVTQVKRILNRSGANIVNSDNGTIFLELDGDVYPVARGTERTVKPFFIVLDSSEAFNVSDYRMLFDVRDLPNALAMGKDITGKEHLCRRHGPLTKETTPGALNHIRLERIEERLEAKDLSQEELDEVKNMVKNLRNGHFFEALTSEFSSKIKAIALELIDFRKDIKKRIEPGIVEIAAKDIPEASNQLEGINETLEQSTMKIMDINDEQMDLANSQMERLQNLLAGDGGDARGTAWERGKSLLEEMENLVPDMPGEARQVMEFVLPGMETGRELMGGRGEAASAREALSEPLETVRDLCRDVGAGDASIQRLGSLLEELEQVLDACDGAEETGGGEPAELRKALADQIDILRSIGALSLKMMEPLSFQDLVGQRIQRIVRLVKSMELRIEDLIISFGIKIQRHKEDPSRTYEDLAREVEHYKSELMGPQTQGEGLDQEGIDDLLASL